MAAVGGAVVVCAAALSDVRIRVGTQFYPDVHSNSRRGLGQDLPGFFAAMLWDSRWEFSNVWPASERLFTGVCAHLTVGQQLMFPVDDG